MYRRGDRHADDLDLAQPRSTARTRPEMVSAFDLVPTLCVLTGADLPARDLAGRSYSPLATGTPLPKKEPWKTTVFARYRNTAMARDDRYKLVVRDEGKGPNELYDYKADPKETSEPVRQPAVSHGQDFACRCN